MKHFLFLLLTLVLLVSCTTSDQNQEESIVVDKPKSELSKPFREKCDMGSSFGCADYRVSKDRIELYLSNIDHWEVGPIFVSTEKCTTNMHSGLVPGQVVRFTLENCDFETETIDEKIRLEYTYKTNNQTVEKIGTLRAFVR